MPPPVARRRQLLLWLLRRRRRFRVEGPSMQPTLQAGDEVLVHPRRAPLPGDLVVARHPHQPTWMVKRYAGPRAGGAWLLGDNADASTDSRHFGPVPADTLVGPVIARFPRPGERP